MASREQPTREPTQRDAEEPVCAVCGARITSDDAIVLHESETYHLRCFNAMNQHSELLV